MSQEVKSASDVAGVIAPPPLIYLGFLLIGFGLQTLWPAPMVTTSWVLRVGIGVSLGLLGILFSASGVGEFRKAQTNVNPMRPALAIVTDGPYRLTRNPMYLGLTLLYGGIAFGFNSGWMLGLLVPILVVMHYGVIAREEAYLERKFGEPYREYRKQVRRWL